MVEGVVVPEPLDHALDRLDAALAGLLEVVGGGLAGVEDVALVTVLHRFERFRNRLSVVDHGLVGEVVARELPQRLTSGTANRFLAATLRISPAEAARRVRAAAALDPRWSGTGQVLAPVRPVLAAAQQSGGVSAEQVAVVERAMREVDRPGFDPAAVADGEQLLTGFAQTFGPQELSRLVVQVVDAINPDGTLPADQLNADRRHLHLRAGRDGSYVGEFRLTGTAGAKLQAVLGPLARPRADGPGGQSGGQQDERTYGQRMHDAVEDVCDRLLRSATLPDSGGTPATVIVTIDLDDLRHRTGYGTSSDGTLLPAHRVLELAGQADLVPAVLSRVGAVVALGRGRRIASPTQTAALIARDHGCSFPGCDRPPEWCERHHIRGWIDGGPTDLDNLTLLCRYHHHNFEQRGWFCRLNSNGIPEWLPPRWVDPHQTPQTNTRITAAHTTRRHRHHLRC